MIELMVVVAILAIILTIGIPFIRTSIDTPRGINGASRLVEDACRDARAKAILNQAPVELIIRSGDGTLTIGEATRDPGADTMEASASGIRRSGSSGGAHVEFKRPYPAKLPEGVRIKGIGVNGEDWTDDEEARVRFRANGTSDAMSILLEAEDGEQQNVLLDIVTGLPETEKGDWRKFRSRY